MIEVYERSRHFPSNIVGRYVVLFHGKKRTPHVRHVYVCQGIGHFGLLTVQSVGGSPDRKVVQDTEVAFVCDSREEAQSLLHAGRGLDIKNTHGEAVARRRMLSLAGINEEPDDLRHRKRTRTGDQHRERRQTVCDRQS